MKLSEFIAQISFLCEARNAARISELFVYAFNRELKGGSPFDRNAKDREDFENRSRYLWDMLFADEEADVEACTLCQKLMEIIERSHYLNEHGEKEQIPLIDKAYAAAKVLEPLYPKIVEAMPADTAVTLSFWDAD